ncbi:MAG: replication initiation factor domain-containing protein [Acholeplasmatales bacterium]|nr:replication initiation factor domain-containing protein [Acholeplasmatales bacterium]
MEVKEEKDIEIKPDYLRASIELEVTDQEFEEEIVNDKKIEIANLLGVNEDEIGERDHHKERYKYMFELGDSMEIGMLGPKNARGIPTCSIHLKGQGCRDFETRNPNKSFVELLKELKYGQNAIFSRIDTAIDIYNKEILDMEYLESKLKKKQFISSFKKKYYKKHGCPEEGESIEMGGRDSPCQLVFYDKLLEQKAKRHDVDKDYWLRCELRFRHEKADQFVTELIAAYDGKLKGINTIGMPAVEAYIKSVLLGILDIKEDNNYDMDHQYLVNTDSRWANFTGTQKWSVDATGRKETSWNKKEDVMSHSLPSYLLTKYMIAGCNPYQFTTAMVDVLYKAITKFEEKKNRKAVNIYLRENGLPPLDDETYLKLKEKIKEDYEERRLPF